MAKTSAGLLAYRIRDGALQVLLVHMGGPFWARKDAGAWTIPKGEIGPDEEPLAAAKREFKEETGLKPSDPVIPLGSVKQRSGKVVHAWAFEGDFDPTTIKSNTFVMEWPPKSGKQQEFPEIDRAEYFQIDKAIAKIIRSEIPLLEALTRALGQS